LASSQHPAAASLEQHTLHVPWQHSPRRQQLCIAASQTAAAAAAAAAAFAIFICTTSAAVFQTSFCATATTSAVSSRASPSCVTPYFKLLLLLLLLLLVVVLAVCYISLYAAWCLLCKEEGGSVRAKHSSDALISHVEAGGSPPAHSSSKRICCKHQQFSC
jgi:hypothetical protein